MSKMTEEDGEDSNVCLLRIVSIRTILAPSEPKTRVSKCQSRQQSNFSLVIFLIPILPFCHYSINTYTYHCFPRLGIFMEMKRKSVVDMSIFSTEK